VSEPTRRNPIGAFVRTEVSVIRAVTLATAVLVAAALLGAADGAAVTSQNPKLSGTVGPGMTIVLRDAQGNRVTQLDPGTYDIDVEDLSVEHNFRLSGPGVIRQTPVEDLTTDTWTVTFAVGRYTYFCQPHSTTMRGNFVVGSPPAEPKQTPPGAVTAKSRLVLTSGPAEVITLKTSRGKTVRTMRLGTYTMTVRDRSAIHNAHVVAPGFNRRTTLDFIGTRTWKVALKRTGTLRFLCDPHAFAGMRGSAKIVR
jgi:plastocyanin